MADNPCIHIYPGRLDQDAFCSLIYMSAKTLPDMYCGNARDAYLMKALPSNQSPTRKAPFPTLPLNEKVQRPCKLSIQPLGIPRLIRLSPPLHRPLNISLHRLRTQLLFPLNPHHRILHQRLHHSPRLTNFIPYQHLIIPAQLPIRLIATQLPRRTAIPLLRFPLPVVICRRVFFEVEISREGHCEALVEAFLVEIEGLLEGREGFGDEWWPRKEDPGFDDVGSYCVAGGDG